MKPFYLTVIVGLCLSMIYFNSTAQQVRLKQNFDKNWLFIKGDHVNASKPEFDDKNWQRINLPHDFRITETVDSSIVAGPHQGFFPGDVVWYRKTFNLSSSVKGKQAIIQFDGVNMNSDYWINDNYIGHRASGYISFWYNITQYLYYDKPNVISVRVDDIHQPFNRWYSGGGIYRHVWLNFLSAEHIPVWGTDIAFKHVDVSNAKGNIETLIRNCSDKQKKLDLTTEIFNPQGKLISSQTSKITIENLKENKIIQSIDIEKPDLWSTENPRMYKAISKLIENNNIIDEYQTPFGIRNIEFSNKLGLLVNGKKVIIKGVNLHQDAGCLGTAVPEKILEGRLKTLKDMGCNAIRMSHYPHAPELLDMCDKMGLLVLDEFIDKRELQFPGYKGETTPFAETWNNDLKLFLDRDRNHPSIFLWSMGNELTEQLQSPKEGKIIYEMMQNFTHNYEPSRKITAAMRPGGSEQPSSIIFSMDVVSYNYVTHDFAKWATQDTNLIFISTETLPYSISAKQFPRTDTVDFSKNSWFFYKQNYVGQFIWAGFDYLGESKGWPDRGCPVGLITTSGVRKPYSYFTESIYSEKPMVHIAVYDPVEAARLNAISHAHRLWYGPPIASHWNFSPTMSKPIPVYVFSNTDSVQLFLNNKYIGASIPSGNSDKVARFLVKYVPGTLKALGYRNGIVVKHQLQTAGKPAIINITSDNSVLISDGSDISLLRIYIKDKNGNICPFANNTIQVKITGAGELAGIDNGDISQHFNFKGNTIKATNGQCIAIVRSNGKKGDILINASTNGLEPAKIILSAK